MQPANYSHVKAGGHGKRRATRKPGHSELHIKPTGCHLEPVPAERGTTTRTTHTVSGTPFAVWRVTWQDKGKPRAVRHFRFPLEHAAREFAATKPGSYVERVKTTDRAILAEVSRVW